MRALLTLIAFAVYFAIAPASDAGWPSSGRAYLPSGGGGACSQATTFLARTSGLSGTQTSAYTALICGMVTDGTWSVMDGLYVFATNSTTTANLNLVSTSYGLIQSGTVSFSANNGYTGDGSTGQFVSGFIPATAGGNWSLNSASIGACVLSSRANSFSYPSIGGFAHYDYSFILPGYAGASGTQFALNGDTQTLASSNSQGAWTYSKTSSSQGYTSINGSTTSVTPAVAIITNSQLYVLSNGNGSYSIDQIAYVFFGGGLTPTQITAVYNRLHTYLSTVGAGSGC